MKANAYRRRWADWLPSALDALAKDPPDFASVMPHMPQPDFGPMPFTPGPSGPLRVALLSSSGVYDRRAQAPYAASSLIGDATHRFIERAAPSAELAFAHEHFDHTAAQADLETVLPRAALAASGAELSAHVVSWSGYLLDWPTFLEATIPQIVKRVLADGVNAALLVPI
ncbi:MAG: hypothetical protein ACREM2_02645 [Vulcanimicrobiaceae bacterium]